MAINQDESAGSFTAPREKIDRLLRSFLGRTAGGTQKFDRGFCHHDLHDRFAVTGAGDAARFRVGVAATTDERRVAYPAWKFTASTASRSSSEKATLAIDGHGANRALFVAAMVLRGVLIDAAAQVRVSFRFADQFVGIAVRNSGLPSKALRAAGDQHHVRTFFQNC